MFVEPAIDWPVSMTDPSQNISVQRLVDDFVSRGLPPPQMTYGVDVSRVDFTVAHAEVARVDELLARQKAEEAVKKKKSDEELALAAELRLKKVVAQLQSSDFKPGSPEVQALAAELTGILPGFKAAVVAPPKEGDSKA